LPKLVHNYIPPWKEKNTIMNTQTIVLILVVLLVLGGLGWWWYSSSQTLKLEDEIIDVFEEWRRAQNATQSLMDKISGEPHGRPEEIDTLNFCLRDQYLDNVTERSVWEKSSHYIDTLTMEEIKIEAEAQRLYTLVLNGEIETDVALQELDNLIIKRQMFIVPVMAEWLAAAPFLDPDACFPKSGGAMLLSVLGHY
jgi:hypothetical protein